MIESGHDVGVGELLQRELCSAFNCHAQWKLERKHQGKRIWAKPAPYQQDEGCPIIDGMAAVQFLSNASAAKPFGEWGS